jgi:hypothetical protein
MLSPITTKVFVVGCSGGGWTGTVTISVADRTPLLAVTVKVSAVDDVADVRCTFVGVYVKVPVAELRTTVPPPVLVVDVLYDKVRPAVSVNATVPVTTPVMLLGTPTVGVPATGVPGSTWTVTVLRIAPTPLLTSTVNVSVVLAPAARRATSVGV